MYKIINSAVVFNNIFNFELDIAILNDISFIKQIIFNKIFNKSINNLNVKITHLVLGKYFNQSTLIFNKFINMTHLKIFNIKNVVFPQSLIWLNIISEITDNIKIDNLPNGLLYLITIGSYCCDNLPCGLLYLSTYTTNYSYNKIPASLKYLSLDLDLNNNLNYYLNNKINNVLDNLSNNINYLIINNNSCAESLIIIGIDTQIVVNNLPQNLKYLKIKLLELDEIILFPQHLTKLILYVRNNISENDLSKIILPCKLKSLTCRFNFHSLNFPNTLKKLVISYICDISRLYLPNNLKILIIFKLENFGLSCIYKNYIDYLKSLEIKYHDFYHKNHDKFIIKFIIKNCNDQHDNFKLIMNNILDFRHTKTNIPNMLN